MQVHTYYPKSPLLKKYVEYYYFFKTTDDKFIRQYYSFPQLSQSLNIHKSAVCHIGEQHIAVNGTHNNKPLMILQGKFEEPLFVQLQGMLDKLTIHFKPLGLNAFMQKPMCDVAICRSQVFTEWMDGVGCNNFLQAFYATCNNDERVDILEKFLCSKYYGFSEEDILQKALAMLHDLENDYPVPFISQSLGMNIRSFNRLFYKHLAISPTGYRKIARFRHSLKNKLVSNPQKTLTEICYESNFYDQAYFIKMYKKLTGSNPYKFFNSVDTLADNRLIFRFVN